MAEEGFYKLSTGLERAVAFYLATSKEFASRLGPFVDPKGFAGEQAQVVAQVVTQEIRDAGAPPPTLRMFKHALGELHQSGKLSKRGKKLVLDMIVDVADDPPKETRDQLEQAFAKILRRHTQKVAIDDLVKRQVRGADTTPAVQRIERAARIGVSDTTIGTRVNAQAVDVIRKLKGVKRSPTGIEDIDFEIKGGLRDRCLGVFIGGPGSGKSMMLSHACIHNAALGFNCALATIGELSEEEQLIRMIANATDIATDDIEDDMDDEAERRIKEIQETTNLGFITVKEFHDGVTVEEIADWLIAEKEQGAPVHALFVDYADKMGWGKDANGAYEGMKVVYSKLRNLMRAGPLKGSLHWVWTAGQAKSEALQRSKTKRVEGHHAADSMWKMRLVDLMITMAQMEDTGEILYHIAKHRSGRGGVDVGPIPHDWEFGRQAPAAFPDGWPSW